MAGKVQSSDGTEFDKLWEAKWNSLKNAEMIDRKQPKDVYRRFYEFVDIVFVQGKQIDWKKSNDKKELIASEQSIDDLLLDEVYEGLKAGTIWKRVGGGEDDKNSWKCLAHDKPNLKNLLNHLEYLWTLGGLGQTRLMFPQSAFENDIPPKKGKRDQTPAEMNAGLTFAPGEGIWKLGMTNTSKPKFYPKLVNLIKNVAKKGESNLEAACETIKTELTTNEEYNKDSAVPLRNALLHFIDPRTYAPIPAKNMKEQIAKNLGFLATEQKTEQQETEDRGSQSNAGGSSQAKGEHAKRNNDIDEKILKIHKGLKDKDLLGAGNTGCIFWPKYASFFSGSTDVSDYSILRAKKAMILYGPPGTSKTYSAKEDLAKSILFKDFATNSKEEFDSFCADHIHRLQLHPNYSYEDFIWGYEISTEGTASVSRPKPGYFLRLLKKMKAERLAARTKKENPPHVLILDEINRVDLSRLFGELFSALENRNEDINLPIQFGRSEKATEDYSEYNNLGKEDTIAPSPDAAGAKICIPDNLYIIGTMNEIDFSLERVDFALRRRFAWVFKGYDADVLGELLSDSATPKNKNISTYIDRCTALNQAIDKDDALGPAYEIGHTIFADIVKICADAKDDNQKVSWRDAPKILWDISIKPLLEAYLENVDADKRKEKLKHFHDKVFFGSEQVDESLNAEEEITDSEEDQVD